MPLTRAFGGCITGNKKRGVFKLKISKKTVYKHFPDKQTLAVALYEKYFSDRCAKRFAYVGIYENGAFYNFRRTETFSRTHTDIGRIRVPRFFVDYRQRDF